MLKNPSLDPAITRSRPSRKRKVEPPPPHVPATAHWHSLTARDKQRFADCQWHSKGAYVTVVQPMATPPNGLRSLINGAHPRSQPPSSTVFLQGKRTAIVNGYVPQTSSSGSIAINARLPPSGPKGKGWTRRGRVPLIDPRLSRVLCLVVRH